MNALVYLVGILSGLLTTGLLRFPLYNYLPGLFVAGWPEIDSRAALYGLIGAGVITIITGGVAALVSGTKRTREAAAAGGVAGFYRSSTRSGSLGRPRYGRYRHPHSACYWSESHSRS